MKQEEIIQKIYDLENDEIDNLFFRCNWIDSNKESNKALPEWRIKGIKDGKEQELLNTFIQEVGEEHLLEELKKESL